MRHGFSLVELSIVLVILGLLTGGILAGQSLIRAAELRSASTEYSRYVAAAQSFRDKYFAFPGDMANATSFWGKDATYCNGHTGTAQTPGTCNGTGDGLLQQAAAVSATGESHQFWKQLALAGLIEGTYSGIAGATAGNTGADTVVGTNAPRSRMPNSGWSLTDFTSAGDASTYAADYSKTLFLGRQLPGYHTLQPSFKPEEAWNIDTKMDDGKPGVGKIMVRDWTGWGTANACTTSTSQTDYAGNYKLDNTVLACAMIFRQAF